MIERNRAPKAEASKLPPENLPAVVPHEPAALNGQVLPPLSDKLPRPYRRDSSKVLNRIRFSETAIAKLRPDPSGKVVIYWDDDIPGFGVAVGRHSKSWVVQRGRETRRKLERVDLLPLAKARERARDWLILMGKGIDPKGHIASPTLTDALDVYLRTRLGGKLRPNTAKLYRKLLALHLADWIDRPITAITPLMVAERHAAIMQSVTAKGGTGWSSANTTIRILGAVLRAARRLRPELVLTSVAETMAGSWAKARRRVRRLPYAKLPQFWSALMSWPDPRERDAIMLLMLTGARKMEILALRWDEVDMDAGVITLAPERVKSDRLFLLPMSDAMLAIFRNMPGRDRSGWVFPSVIRGKYLSTLHGPLVAIGAAIGEEISSHDFRRLHKTTARHRAGLSDGASARLLNHARAAPATGTTRPISTTCGVTSRP